MRGSTSSSTRFYGAKHRGVSYLVRRSDTPRHSHYTVTAMPGDPAPEQFGRYILHERIGRGGMAEIFRASYKTGKFEKALVMGE